MRKTDLSHQFVEFIPEQLEEGVLYISQRYGTAAHKCCCGCGEEVITPLTSTDWSLQMDGNVVTLYPSIGNWSFACRSHYWIRRSKVIWAGQMSQQQIDRGRAIDRATKQTYFEAVNRKKALHSKLSPNEAPSRTEAPGLFNSLWMALKHWWNT
ncbi:DUF6527 family protein [Sulfuricaulis sp.]|jgi:hypothetical protein|uniref:DUF6527 family protein n=1 Tax=Sulfuricaulis sp. TaxID=2003553 RepID=UPI00355A824B